MARRPEPGDAPKPSQPFRSDFWGRRLTQVVVALAAIAMFVGVAILGNPEHESWQTKTREVMHSLVTRTLHGHARAQ
jgi:hypothetical protein